MAKKRSNPASRRAKNALARRVQKIQYANRTAIITQDEVGRVKILSTEKHEPGTPIRSNAAAIMEKIIFQPPFLPKEDADYLRSNIAPLIDDPDRLRNVY